MVDKTPAEAMLQERLARGAKAPRTIEQSREQFVAWFERGHNDDCDECKAEPGEPCISMKTGKTLPESKTHKARQSRKSALKWRGDSNRLSAEGIEFEMAKDAPWVGRNPAERLRIDPPEQSVIGEAGAYVTFAGSVQKVHGAHSTLRPGETYYAHWASETKEGWTKWGQFLITINTERGPAWLFPDEYVVLSPAHLWYLVCDGTLKFTPSEGLGKHEFGERVHYIRSRGIGLEQAILMCLGDVKTDIGYFTPAAQFDARWWRFQSVGLTPMEKDRIADALAAAMAAEVA